MIFSITPYLLFTLNSETRKTFEYRTEYFYSSIFSSITKKLIVEYRIQKVLQVGLYITPSIRTELGTMNPCSCQSIADTEWLQSLHPVSSLVVIYRNQWEDLKGRYNNLLVFDQNIFWRIFKRKGRKHQNKHLLYFFKTPIVPFCISDRR